MNSKLDKNQIERFSRQIILKNIGILGQKKIIQSKVLIIGMGGLGCPVADAISSGLTGAGEVLATAGNTGADAAEGAGEALGFLAGLLANIAENVA